MRTRLPVALVSVAAAVLIGSGSVLAGSPVPPEHQTGSVGPYLIRDGSQSTPATCHYTDSGPLKLERISVKPPEVRWPDTNSENPNQHGTVSHRITIERSTDDGDTWTKLRSSTTQKATATEQDAADLTKRIVTLDLNGAHTLLRIQSRIRWVRPDGSVRGTLRHWYAYARWNSDQLQGSVESGICPNVPNV